MSKQIGTYVKIGRVKEKMPDPLFKYSGISSGKGWLSEDAEIAYKADQVSYTVPHQKNFIQPQGEQGDVPNLNVAGPSGIGSRTSRLQAQESLCEFDMVSTVLAPSVLTNDQSEEYTSTLSVGDLKKSYFSNYKNNKQLPVYSYRRNLINSINSYSVVIVEGSTGCGKTTQVPCYIMEDAILNRPDEARAPVIYVTQPRRIAARSIAERVCQEHGWTVGSLVGYQIGLEKVAGPETVLVYCTSGVLLQKLIQDKSLVKYTHIVIDEVHERDSDTDLLLMMIRKLMSVEKSFFRLLVMSATMDTSKLRNYFTFPAVYAHRAVTEPSLCTVQNSFKEKAGCNPQKNQILYLDSFRQIFNLDVSVPSFEFDIPELFDDLVTVAVNLVVNTIPNLDTFREDSKSTLIFLPGLTEIIKLDKLLRPYEYLEIIPLHSTISSIEQNKIFLRLPPGRRKVILATNIAESSITVDDVGFVIDFCLTKTLRKDPYSKFPTLKLEWCSADKCTQRAGRTGRTCEGKVFRMVTKNFFRQFRKYAEPELLTAPLELSVLRVKNFGLELGGVQGLFALVLDPPPIDDIRTAMLELKQIGAITATYQGKLCSEDGDLTELGRVISALPIDVHLSKLIVMAQVLDVLEPAITVAACLSTNRSVVRNLYGNQLKSYQCKLEWARGSYSDLFVNLDVYKQWNDEKEKEQRSKEHLSRLCKQYNLDENKLREIDNLIEELKQRLDQLNIRILDQPNRERDHLMDEFMLKVAFCAAFYPNFFVTEDIDKKEARDALHGLDPTKAVIIHGLPVNQAPLYCSQLTKAFSSVPGIRRPGLTIEYIADISRAMMIFDSGVKMPRDKSSEAVAGDVLLPSSEMELAVYLALKMSEVGDKKLSITEYQPAVATERMDYYLNARAELSSRIPNRLLPSCTKVVRGRKADNSKLLTENPEDYIEFMSGGSFVEVEIDESHERLDSEQIEIFEKSVQSRLATREQEPNSIFKNERKFLTGPTSPIMLKFRPILEKCKSHGVSIDPMSVNSILLNPDYEEPRRQMLVASEIAISRSGKVIARNTTLMPNIRGLTALMSLLFAQYYKIVHNDQLKCIAGAVFGLGWNQDESPLNKEYEVELGFDVQITQDDMELINLARQEISSLLQLIGKVEDMGLPLARRQQNLRGLLMQLFKKKRTPINEVLFDKIDWSKSFFTAQPYHSPDEHVQSSDDGGTRAFLPIMRTGRIYPEAELFIAVEENLEQLRKINDGEELCPQGGIYCYLCSNCLSGKLVLRNHVNKHLLLDSHNTMVEAFESFRIVPRRYTRDELVALRPAVDVDVIWQEQ